MISKNVSLYYPDSEPPLSWLKPYLLFHEKIARLLPPDEDNIDSDDFNYFREAFPEAIVDIPASLSKRNLSSDTLSRLELAFAEIAGEIDDTDSITVNIGVKGISYPGYAFMSPNKISDDVANLLKKYTLLAPEALQTSFKEITGSSYIIVEDKASSLIISLLADGVANDKLMPTVTNYPMDYSLVMLNAMGAEHHSGSIPGKDISKLVASTYITTFIPENLGNMPLHEYKKVRERYIDLREPLENVIRQLTPDRLGEITNVEYLRQQVEEIADELHGKIEDVRKDSRLLQSIHVWTPFTLSKILTLATAFAVVPPEMKPIVAGTAVTISLFDKVKTMPNNNDDLNRLERRLASLERDLDPGFFKQLLKRLADIPH